MKESLLTILKEPETGAPLTIDVNERRDGEIWQGVLTSAETGRSYPIREGIPRFVESDSYTQSFGLQWNRFAKVQLDSANGASYSSQRFENEVGWSHEQLAGQWVLDGGCGCGRFAEIAAQRGAQVIALDYSSAIEAAAENLHHYDNVHYVQGDLLRLPIQTQAINFVYSIGVLQHTPAPQAALASLLQLLKPGGRFALSCYGKRWYTRLCSKYLIRPVTRNLPPRVLLSTIERAMPVFFPLTDTLFRIPKFGKLAEFLIPIANYVDKSDFSREQRYQEAILDTFDMLSPAFDSPMTFKQVLSVFKRLGIEDYLFQSTVPIHVTGSAST